MGLHQPSLMSVGEDEDSLDRPDAALGDVNPSRGIPVQPTGQCDTSTHVMGGQREPHFNLAFI